MGKKFDSNGCSHYIYPHDHMPLVSNLTLPVIPASATLKSTVEGLRKYLTEQQMVEDLYEVLGWSYQEIRGRTGLL